MNIIFLDIDGVLNCQLLYEKNKTKKELRKQVKKEQITRDEYYADQLCTERIEMLNELCKDTDAKVVISSTWRMGKTVSQLQKILNDSGATFEIIDTTPILRFDGAVRGNEIKFWIDKNIEKLCGIKYFDYHTYAIVDDDSDMLYWQRNNLFLTDNYSGLTPNTCYRIKQFFNKQYFPNLV
jgi:hypothetical protein